MSKQAKTYDAKEMFLRGIIAFGRAMGLIKNPYSYSSQAHRTKDEERKRRKSHAKFKAQRIARRERRA